MQDLFIIALAVLGFGLVSGRLHDSMITPPMAYVGAGLILGPSALGWLDLSIDQGGCFETSRDVNPVSVKLNIAVACSWLAIATAAWLTASVTTFEGCGRIFCR